MGEALTSFGPDEAVARWFFVRSVEHPLFVDVGEVMAVALHPWMFRVVVVAAAWIVWRGGHRRTAALAVACMAGGGVLGALAKVVVHRPRPVWADPVAAEVGYSMPSGHALNAALGCGLLLLMAWRVLGPGGRGTACGVAVLVVVLAALDRLVLGVHYLTDVVVGALLGAGLAAATAFAVGRRAGAKVR